MADPTWKPSETVAPDLVNGDGATSAPVDVSPSKEGPAPRHASSKKPFKRSLVEWLVIIAIALLAAFLIKTYLVQAFWIPSGSMEPTLEPGDRVLVSKIAYDLHPVHRGDIVVFKKPANDVAPGIKDLIKRVVGLPGETIQGIGGGVYINGHRLAQKYLPRGVTTAPFGPVKIPKGDYFMMGDNRGDSADSRVFGPVPGKLIIGRAFVRIWPLSRLYWFKR